MQNPVRVGMPSVLGLLLAAFAFRLGRSQDITSCSTEAILCLADDDCSVCAGQLQELQEAGTITSDTDCLAFFGEVCSAVDETCDVTNEFLVDLAACLAEDQLGCTGFTSTTCAEATAITEAPLPTPAMVATTAPSGSPTMMATTANTESPTMAPTMATTANTESPTMAPTATTGAPTITPGFTMGPTAVSNGLTPIQEEPSSFVPPTSEEAEGGNAGVRLSSAATVTTTLAGLALVGGLLVVPSRVL